MCGRYVIEGTTELSERFQLRQIPADLFPEWTTYNAAPTQLLPVIVEDEAGERRRYRCSGAGPALAAAGWQSRGGADQRPCRDAARETDVSRPRQGQALHRPRQRLLRVAEGRRPQAALLPHLRRRSALGAGRDSTT